MSDILNKSIVLVLNRNWQARLITVIGTNWIHVSFDDGCLQQVLNARSASGVTDLALNQHARSGYGATVACVLVSPILCVLASWLLCVNAFAVFKMK
jgi:hypothetical protein